VNRFGTLDPACSTKYQIAPGGVARARFHAPIHATIREESPHNTAAASRNRGVSKALRCGHESTRVDDSLSAVGRPRNVGHLAATTRNGPLDGVF